MNYIGIDIGDGESCVCILPGNSDIEPRPIALTGRKSFTSAVALNADGDILIGMDAVGSTAAQGFSVRFKSRFLDGMENDLRDMQRFLCGIHEVLQQQNILSTDDKVVIGCPAGWNLEMRERYQCMIEKAGFPQPRLVSESRAAFLYAKHAKTIQLAPELIDSSALVIDIGSSTLDFAYVIDGKESNVGTFGEVYLGGGAIDEALLEAAVNASVQKKEIQEIFEEAPEWRSYCLLAARRVKEDFFIQQSEGKEHIRCRETPVILYDIPIELPIQVNEQMMWRVIHLGIKALDDISFFQILENALKTASKQTEGRPPRLVLMTGGASRMGFFQEQCIRQFPKALIVLCEEPEFSIAKGLAYAARVDEEIYAFNGAIAAYIETDRIANEIDLNMPDTIDAIAASAAEIALTVIGKAVDEWRHGKYATLDAMNQALPDKFKQAMETPVLQEAIANSMQTHIQRVCTVLQKDIDAICDTYHVAKNYMQLVQTSGVPTGILNAPISLQQGIRQLTAAVQGIVTALVAGVMLLIPGGQIVDLVLVAATAVAVLLGKNFISGLTVSINIPVFLRKQISVERVANEELKNKLQGMFHQQLNQNTEVLNGMTGAIHQSIANHISRMAQKTEIAIVSGEEG